MNQNTKLVEAIYKAWEKRELGNRREHLGASEIGAECDRAIWYGFRWRQKQDFDGRILRLFNRGKREEDVVYDDLEATGAQVFSKQVSFEMWGGHFAGSADGICVIGKENFVIEIKTANAKNWQNVHKSGVAVEKPQHYCQMQIYMGAVKLKRGIYICVNKNTDEIHAETIEFNQEEYDALVARAKSIVFSNSEPEKLTENAADYRCKQCPYWSACFENKEPDKNCRMCSFSVPNEDGGWYCAKHRKNLTKQEQEAACTDWKDIKYTPF